MDKNHTMSLCKEEVLLSCFVMMTIFFIPTQPTGQVELQTNLRVLALSLCTLRRAEEDYIKYMFSGQPPKGYKSEPLQGLTWPAGNTTEEIQTSICAITDYLENHMPVIIRAITWEHKGRLIKKTTAFITQFKAAVRRGQRNVICPKHCHRNITTASDYTKIETGLRIFYFTRRWVEHFANATCGF